MIRERRNKEKLQQYYQNFVEHGLVDPNVHPWVAESWERSRELKVEHQLNSPHRLSQGELLDRQKRHQPVIDFIFGLYSQIHEYFVDHKLSLILSDHDCYILKNYALPYFQNTSDGVEGMSVAEEDIGTSSIAIALRHKTPFLLFGPEMWMKESHDDEACSAPVVVDGQVKYIITLLSFKPGEIPLPNSAHISLLLSIQYAVENYLKMQMCLETRQTIIDAVPLAVYHVLPGGEVAYTNKLGESRLAGIDLHGRADKLPNLSEAVLNYHHTPIHKGFSGIPSYNKEVTWITDRKTYEDITTVVPLYDEEEVTGVVAVSLPIEDLRMLVAHAAGYTARYSLSSMVGKSHMFKAMKEKAARAARNHYHVLLQGEPGIGKQRLAHGIHQASPRAAGPLITVRCGEMPQEFLETDLFGSADTNGESRPGKLELANGGTLFLDEVEKLTAHLQARLTAALTRGEVRRAGEGVERPVDVRIIAACDNDLKRLSERGVFASDLYDLLSKVVVRIPALRTRQEDIPLLAAHIMTELVEQHHIAPRTLSPEASELLMSYDWPGNIKQLQGVVEQAFFRSSGDVITVQDIELPGEASISKAWKESPEAFMEAWKAAGGNISRLANMLDVSRVTLYRYMEKYGIKR